MEMPCIDSIRDWRIWRTEARRVELVLQVRHCGEEGVERVVGQLEEVPGDLLDGAGVRLRLRQHLHQRRLQPDDPRQLEAELIRLRRNSAY